MDRWIRGSGERGAGGRLVVGVTGGGEAWIGWMACGWWKEGGRGLGSVFQVGGKPDLKQTRVAATTSS